MVLVSFRIMLLIFFADFKVFIKGFALVYRCIVSFLPDKPRGTVIQSNLTNNVVEGPAGINLTCIADAIPVPHLYEFFVNDKKHGESSNGVLELSSVGLPYLSTIKCVPHNRYWTGEGVQLNITVQGRLFFGIAVTCIF